MEAEAAFVISGSLLLFGVDRKEGGVEVDSQLFRAHSCLRGICSGRSPCDPEGFELDLANRADHPARIISRAG